MHRYVAGAIALALALTLPVAASADLPGAPTSAQCIAAQSAAMQASLDARIVQQSLQSGLQNQLDRQRSALANQQVLSRLQLHYNLDQNNASLARIEALQQLHLLELELRSLHPLTHKIH